MGRSAHDLTGDDLVLGHFTLGRTFPLEQRMRAAATSGVAGVGLSMADLEHHAAAGTTDDDLDRLLRSHDLVFTDLDLINLVPARADLRARSERFTHRAVELASRFGYRYLQTVGPEIGPDAGGFDEVVDALGAVADAVAPHGVEVGLEYVGFSTVATATDALAVVDAVGRANVGVCVDIWHHRRASSHVDLAATVPARLVSCIQMNDGPLVPDSSDYKDDCLRHRLPPGEGEMDAVGFVATLIAMGVDVPWTIEVCRADDELVGERGYDHVQRSVTGMRDVLAAARAGAGRPDGS